MEEETPNINVIRSVWRRLNKDIKIRDLQPVKDVKGGGGGGVTDKSKPTTGSSSSARTMKRFPSPRCASATKFVRLRASTVATQTNVQPALLRLWALNR